MLRVYQLPNGLGDPVPEAIFWRPLRWFAPVPKADADGLDGFLYVTYELGNWLRFDLRTYAGHPPGTTTLYLSLGFGSLADIQHAVARASEELRVPRTALAWRRGVEFRYGELPRNAEDRLREPEARLIALKVAALMPDRTATTEQIIDGATDLFTPSRLDLVQSRTRERQPQWHQIIRNVISHRRTPSGPFERGFAVRTPQGLSVTQAGLDYLASVGFTVGGDDG